MPKINKDTLKTLKNGVKVFKYENKNSYNCYFQVGSTYAKSGKKYYGLGTKNINDATIRANTKYKEWHTTNAEKSKKFLDFDLDVAQPYLRYKIRKYRNKTNIKDNEQGSRDKAKWENFLKPYFEDVNYHDTDEVERIIDDEVLSDLKEQGKSGNTINKYMSVLTQMYKRAKDRGTVNVIPDTPTQQVIDTPRHAYENEELNLINERCRQEYNMTKNIFWLDFKDCLNLFRCAGFRPGLEPLSLKRKHFRYVQSKSNPNQTELFFDLYNTKTEPFHSPIANEFYTQHIFPELRDRHSNLKDNDYLLFPNIKERNLLKHKTGKLFVRFSKELKLYHFKGGTRPLYSIRHTYATEQWKKGTSIEDIAELMNTSERMVLSVYLSHTDEALLKLAARRGKLKVVK